jgi:prophage tail gpP-like protein
MTPSDDVSIKIGGVALKGWLDVRVSRGIERMPSDFSLRMTERYPESLDAMQITPGSACEVWIGADRVVTGYVDRVMPSIHGRSHDVTVTGRGKCQDLVDCAAEWPNFQFSNIGVQQLAADLAKPFGITVESTGDMGDVIPWGNIMIGETPWEIIERWARVRQLLAYETTSGTLMLHHVAKGEVGAFPLAASGFQEGVNVERAVANWSADQRFSVYTAHRMNVDIFQDVGEGANLLGVYTDPGVKRFRPRRIIMETGGYGDAAENARERAQWEASRRFGRSGVIKLVTDSWRDKSGALYTPGTSVPVDIPALHKRGTDGAPWVISELAYIKGERGTTCDLTLMPHQAFAPQPVLPPAPIAAELMNLPPNLGKQ